MAPNAEPSGRSRFKVWATRVVAVGYLLTFAAFVVYWPHSRTGQFVVAGIAALLTCFWLLSVWLEDAEE